MLKPKNRFLGSVVFGLPSAGARPSKLSPKNRVFTARVLGAASSDLSDSFLLSFNAANGADGNMSN